LNHVAEKGDFKWKSRPNRCYIAPFLTSLPTGISSSCVVDGIPSKVVGFKPREVINVCTLFEIPSELRRVCRLEFKCWPVINKNSSPTMKTNSPASLLPSLQAAACVVILLWGIRTTSSVLGPMLLGLMVAYAILPFPTWLIRRFKLSKRRATTLTAVALTTTGLLALITLEAGIARLAARVPVFEQHWAVLYDQIIALVSRFRGIDLEKLSIDNLTAQQLGGMIMSIVPGATAIASEALLICLLASLFVIEMLPENGVNPGVIASALQTPGIYARSYVVVTAKSAGINALINLVFLLALGVETPFLWCILYFFLAFIPILGPIIALTPPIFLALLMLGWKRALLVACVLILTQVIVGNVLMPILAKKAMSISFLEFTLSLVAGTFLLGLSGAITAIPLTLVLKEFVGKYMNRSGNPQPESA
jgi:predicted PurR-regulated permease PerM